MFHDLGLMLRSVDELLRHAFCSRAAGGSTFAASHLRSLSEKRWQPFLQLLLGDITFTLSSFETFLRQLSPRNSLSFQEHTQGFL